MKKFSVLLVVVSMVIFTGCSNVVATRTTFDIESTKLSEDQVLTIVEKILAEEGMMVSNREQQETFKMVKASHIVDTDTKSSTSEQVVGMALKYLVGTDEFKLYFVLDDGKMYLYGTLKNVKDQIVTKKTTYIDMTQDFGNSSLAKMNKIAVRIKEESGIEGRVWNTTGKRLGSEYGVN